MGKLLAAVLAAVLAAAGAAGAAPVKTLIHYHNSVLTFDEINRRSAAAFMARNPGIEVKLVLLPDNSYRDILRTTLASGKPVDSFILSMGESAEFLAASQMAPIVPSAFGKSSVADVLAMWTPGAFEACGSAWDGRYYGIPFELSNYVGWVNVRDMKEAGLDPARDLPRTWEQFVQVARKLTKVEGGRIVRNGFMCNAKDGIFNFLILAAMLQQLGLDMGSEKAIVSSMERPDVLARGLRTYTDFVTKSGIWDPSFAENDRVGFAENKTAMFLTGGTWYFGLLVGAPVPSAAVEPFPYPRFPDGKDIGGVGYGYSLFVSRKSRDPEAAFRLVDAMASRPDEFVRFGYYQPRRTLSDGSPGLDAAMARKYIPFYDRVFRPELARTSTWLTSTRGSEVTDAFWRAITRVIYERKTVEESVAALQVDIRGLFGR